MSLADYVATPRDRFELDKESRGLGLLFPCDCCKHRHNKDTGVPCYTCDHNGNAAPAMNDRLSYRLLDAFDRIRDAAVKAFTVSRASARRDPIGKVQAEREFYALFGVIQDEKRKASNDKVDRRGIPRPAERLVGQSGGAE